jgi:hypothetical protein
VGEGEDDMGPVLLKHGVGLVDDEEFDGGKEVVVEFFGSGGGQYACEGMLIGDAAYS